MEKKLQIDKSTIEQQAKPYKYENQRDFHVDVPPGCIWSLYLESTGVTLLANKKNARTNERLMVVYARELQQWLQSGLWMSCRTSMAANSPAHIFGRTAVLPSVSDAVLLLPKYTGSTGSKHHGYSFYIAVTGVVFYFISLCFSIFYTIYVIRESQLSYDNVGQARQSVAEDTDVNRYVQSGLWLYCPGAAQCWYIFSDDLINYYEKVDVCRFLLIGDCRKKLLRTPYFFGWHYAVFILNIIVIVLVGCAAAMIVPPSFRKHKRRVATIIFDVLMIASVLILAISLMTFVVNAEMLESKYLIGVKNTFEKYYGYSFYLTCIALLLLVFASLGGLLATTFAFTSSNTSSKLDPRCDSQMDTNSFHEQMSAAETMVPSACPQCACVGIHM
ncbi:Clc-like protein [Teladorsagia circumcincta]|uniref:Clc-like protein n=1 Tax=Teladorsagia circumcincta TaxID=45464 RepID=A0A2G9UBV1_TELCI|nr:Clc-like protein [Teladorsagia circumcincta]